MLNPLREAGAREWAPSISEGQMPAASLQAGQSGRGLLGKEGGEAAEAEA